MFGPMKRRDFVTRGATGVAASVATITFGWWDEPRAQTMPALVATPSQTTGPFYANPPPAEQDNDLTRVGEKRAAGETVFLSGLLFDAVGKSIPDARIEIWQCNANGRYHHPRDQSSAALDPGFQGFGAHRTDATGAYRFTTIHPVPYPGRTPHIHFLVAVPGRRAFVTQMYVAGHPGNERDGLLANIADPRQRATLLVPFNRLSGGTAAEWSAKFDIVLPM